MSSPILKSIMKPSKSTVITQQPKPKQSPSKVSSKKSSPTVPRQPIPVEPMALEFLPNGMPMPMVIIPGCPYGLEFLIGTDSLVINEDIEVKNEIYNNVFGVGVEYGNKYDIFNSFDQRIYFAAEEPVQGIGIKASMTGKARPFKIVILNYEGRPVLFIERPWSSEYYASTCCNCCGTNGTKMNVNSGDGSLLGEVVQEPNGTQPLFYVIDYRSNLLAKIIGPGGSDCCCCCCSCSRKPNKDFNLFMPDGTEVGKIKKHWGGLAVERYTDATTFGVNYPYDIDVRAKALIMAAVFLIDLMFFDKRPSNHSFHHHRNSSW